MHAVVELHFQILLCPGPVRRIDNVNLNRFFFGRFALPKVSLFRDVRFVLDDHRFDQFPPGEPLPRMA